MSSLSCEWGKRKEGAGERLRHSAQWGSLQAAPSEGCQSIWAKVSENVEILMANGFKKKNLKFMRKNYLSFDLEINQGESEEEEHHLCTE